jgi:hypothetical protein
VPERVRGRPQVIGRFSQRHPIRPLELGKAALEHVKPVEQCDTLGREGL